MSSFQLFWDSPQTGFRRCRVQGELDIASAPALEADVLRELCLPASVLVIDLQELEFLDSSGLRALLLAQGHAEQAGARLVLVPGPPQVQAIFEVAEVASWFEFADGTTDGRCGSDE